MKCLIKNEGRRYCVKFDKNKEEKEQLNLYRARSIGVECANYEEEIY